MALLGAAEALPLVSVAVALAALAPQAAAKFTEGVLPTDLTFREYVGKFCYDYAAPKDVPTPGGGAKPVVGVWEFAVQGVVQEGEHSDAVIEGPPCWGRCQTQGRAYLMAFDDQEGRWEEARDHWRDMSCEQLHHVSNWAEDISGPLSHEGVLRRVVPMTEGLRPRFWYFAFVNCGARVVQPVSYSLHMKNIHQGFAQEFGFDRKEMVPMQTCFGFLFMLVAAATCLVEHGDQSGGERTGPRPPPLFRVLQLSSFCSAMGCSCFLAHSLAYAQDGKGIPLFKVVGTLSACAGKGLITVLFVSLARGWAFLVSPHQRRERRVVSAMLACVLLLTLGCEIHGEYFHDQSTSIYLYESWPGLMILALNTLVLAWCLLSLGATYSREKCQDLRALYRLLWTASLFFFASLPAVCLLAALLSPWVRRKYVDGVELGVRLAVTVVLFLCLRPAQFNVVVSSARLVGQGGIEFKDAAKSAGEEGPEEDEDNNGGGPDHFARLPAAE